MDQERDRIRERSGQQDEQTLLLQKGKRGILNVIFGRTMLVLVMLGVQIALLVMLFNAVSRSVAPWIYAMLVVAYVALVLHMVNQSSDPSVKITWILLTMALPPVGVTLYLFVEMDIGHRLLNRRLGEIVRDTARYVPDRGALQRRLAREKPELAALARYTWDHGNYRAYENTAVDYYPSGEASMEAMIAALEQAEKFIFLEFFIIDEGYMWGRILAILERKAQQGVEVRVMYDGTCAMFRLPYSYPRMLEKLGIRCKMFAPLRPVITTYYNNRDHRKILVVDGRVAFTGGVNLADEYINRKALFGHWKDTSIRLEGEAVTAFTLMFLQMWNINEEKAEFARYLAPAAPVTAPGRVLPYGDSPLDEERVGEMVYLDILNRARRYVHIMTPYLILDSEMLTALTFAAKRGVDVAVMLPHIPDKRYAFALAKTHYAQLLRSGVRILEYTPGFVHAKSFVCDDEKAVVGTINLDYRSLYLHFECAAYLEDMPAVQAIEADFRKTALQCREITLADVQDIPLLTRAAGWLLKVLAPVM